MMESKERLPLPKARILGAGQSITVEDPRSKSRYRVLVDSRAGRTLHVTSLPGSGVKPDWKEGVSVHLRVVRPFGMFRYSARVVSNRNGSTIELQLDDRPPRRRQLREYFRLPVQLSVQVSTGEAGEPRALLRALDLSAGGLLLMDLDRRLSPGASINLGLPIGPAGEILRVWGRVVRTQNNPSTVAVSFDGIHESTRQVILRYLFREHRRRAHHSRSPRDRRAKVTALHERA